MRRIKEVIDAGPAATQTYALKQTTGKFNANLKRYNQELLDYIKQELMEMLFFFGYATIKPSFLATEKTPEIRPTDFFEYEEDEVP